MTPVCIYLPPRQGGDEHKEDWDMLGTCTDREDRLTTALEIFRQLSPEQQVEIVALTNQMSATENT